VQIAKVEYDESANVYYRKNRGTLSMRAVEQIRKSAQIEKVSIRPSQSRLRNGRRN